MGKAKRWFKRLVAKLRSDSNPHDKPLKPFTNEAHSNRIAAEANSSSSSAPEVPEYDIDETRNHSIRVTSQAVVKLNSSRICYAAPSPQRSAALVIQSHFRGYLDLIVEIGHAIAMWLSCSCGGIEARRALRALKGLVKLQALVRGHITRRKTAETMRRIEAMLRAQARAISLRSYGSPISSDKSSHIYHPGPQTPEKLEMTSYSRVSSNTQSPILSKGSGSMSRSINRVIIHPDNTYLNSPGWSESQSNRQHGFFYDPLKNLSQSVIQDESVICTAENSPQLYHSVSSKGGSTSSRRQSPMMTPTKSDTSAASCLSGYSDCPAYMAYTESSKAKVRASSVPRNRPQQCGKTATSAATRACFASKAYTGSGRFDRLGMMVKNNTNAYNSGCLNQGV